MGKLQTRRNWALNRSGLISVRLVAEGSALFSANIWRQSVAAGILTTLKPQRLSAVANKGNLLLAVWHILL